MPPGRQEAKKEEEEEEKAPPLSRSNNGDDKDFPLIYAVKTCCFSPCPLYRVIQRMFMPISESTRNELYTSQVEEGVSLCQPEKVATPTKVPTKLSPLSLALLV